MEVGVIVIKAQPSRVYGRAEARKSHDYMLPVPKPAGHIPFRSPLSVGQDELHFCLFACFFTIHTQLRLGYPSGCRIREPPHPKPSDQVRVMVWVRVN